MTINPHCRIGKVRHKDSPHLVEIIPEVRGGHFRDLMHRHVDGICDSMDRGIAMYAIVALDFQGHFNRATRIHPDAFFGPTLLPTIVSEILRRDTMEDAARDVYMGDL